MRCSLQFDWLRFRSESSNALDCFGGRVEVKGSVRRCNFDNELRRLNCSRFLSWLCL